MQLAIAIVCLVFSIIGTVLAVPGARLATHQLREVSRGKGAELVSKSSWTPIVSIIICLILGGIGILLLVYHPKKTEAASPPQSQSVSSPPAPVAAPTNPPTPARKKPTKKTDLGTTTVTQDGHDNQQTVVPGNVVQANGGGCNQQVVGGNGNTQNCSPQPITISDAQKKQIVTELTGIDASNFKLDIVYETGAENGQELAERFRSIFAEIGIPATISGSVAFRGCSAVDFSGVSLDCLDDTTLPVARRISQALQNAKVITSPLKEGLKPQWMNKDPHIISVSIRKP